MNYLLLKNIIEATIANFSCQKCSGKIEDKDINVIGTAGNGIHMEINCPQCKTSGVIKAEVNILGNLAGQTKFLENLKKMMEQANSAASAEGRIAEADILSLREDLKNAASARDLFQ